MTLVAAFRCQNGGILLCADREEIYGDAKRQVDKIYPIHLPTFQVFIAAAGPANVISRACSDIHNSLTQAFSDDRDIKGEFKGLIESDLHSIHEKYAANLQGWPLDLIVIFAPLEPHVAPLLYRTDMAMMISAQFYVAYGSGQRIADYLADRLYDYERLDNATLLAMAAFIFREAEESTGGVGMGVDMMWIREGNAMTMSIGPDLVKDLQDQIPNLSDAIYSHWKEHVKVPKTILPKQLST